MMNGPSMVTLVYGDVAAGDQGASCDFARLNEAVFQVRAASWGNQVVNVEQVRALTTLPSREVMLGRVIGGIQAPISSFVGTLAAHGSRRDECAQCARAAVGAASKQANRIR